MKGPEIQRCKGFATITVMVISLLGGLIVFDTLQENINQERMAGNYSKEINAHLQAENGLSQAYNIMLSVDSSLSTDDRISQLNSNQNTTGGYQHTINAWLDSDSLEINSSGFHYEGQYAMRGAISLASSSGNSVFTGAITTCDGGTLGGSGTIDSYDSSKGAYSSNNKSSNGDLSVLNEDASGLTLSGDSPINGSVSINGDLTMSGSASIAGDAHVSGSINLGSSGSIDGNAQATGNVTNSYSPISMDSISANGDVTILDSYDGPVSYGGDLNYPDYGSVNNTTYYDTPQVAAVGTEICDILDLASEFDNTTNGVGSLANSNATAVDFGYPRSEYVISDSGLTAYDQTWNIQDWVDVETQTETITFLDSDTSVYVLDVNSFGDASLSLTVESGSNVTIYLNESTFIGGTINVEDGASLTIITESEINMGSDGIITNVIDSNGDGTYEPTTAAVNSNGEISTIIYSGYDSAYNNDYGISVAGGNDSTFTAYAPEASINVSGGGDIFGSLRGDYLNVTGGAGIHFDEQIAATNIGGTGSATGTPKITRWF